MTLETGRRLGPYEVLAPIGAGGMGEVYRARDSRLGREVALKVVAARHGEDPGALRRFAREAKIAARLTHPNVCTLFDADTDGEIAYFVMELLEGETLASRLARGPLPELEARRIGADVARGLARAHALGFVHRDLKPQNVFLTPSGAKILDFGLARSGAGEGAEDEETASLLTEAGRLLGTVGYMAPEQVRGEPPAAAADLWALGCILYECLAGRRTFGGRTAQETFAVTLTSPPEWSALPRDLSSSTRTLLERLLDKDPATRLSDAAVVERELSGGSAPTGPPVAPTPPRRRRQVLAAVALVAAAGLLGAVAVHFAQSRSIRARKGTENEAAYEAWLSGRQHVSRRSEAELSQALADFQKAVDADPLYARGWAGIAETWDVLAYSGLRPEAEALMRAKTAASRALEIDPSLADAHAVRAHVTMLAGDLAGAETGFRKALELDPRCVKALHWYSHLLMRQKHWDESLALSRRLIEIDPMGFWNVHLGEHYRAKGDRDLALEQFRRAVALDGNLPNARWELGRFLLEEGRADEAVGHLEVACRLDPDSPLYLRDLAKAYERVGRTADAARVRAAAGASPR